jgi:hypothetical protein
LAPQVGLEPQPEIPTAETIVLKFSKNTSKTSIDTGFERARCLPQETQEFFQIADRQYKKQYKFSGLEIWLTRVPASSVFDNAGQAFCNHVGRYIAARLQKSAISFLLPAVSMPESRSLRQPFVRHPLERSIQNGCFRLANGAWLPLRFHDRPNHGFRLG